MIQKIYEVDPLICPKCQGAMRIISFIEDPSVIRDSLEHLGLWLIRARPPPKIHAPPEIEYPVDVFLSHTSADTHLHGQSQDEIYGDPEYTRVPFRVWDDYIQS